MKNGYELAMLAYKNDNFTRYSKSVILCHLVTT